MSNIDMDLEQILILTQAITAILFLISEVLGMQKKFDSNSVTELVGKLYETKK